MGYSNRRIKTFLDSNYVVVGGLLGLVGITLLLFFMKKGGGFRSAAAGIFGAAVAGGIIGGFIENIINYIRKRKNST
jgi:outer membrane lipoprotein SlyB